MNSDGTVATGIELIANCNDPDGYLPPAGYREVIYRWQRSFDNTNWYEINRFSNKYTLQIADVAHFVRVRVHYKAPTCMS